MKFKIKVEDRFGTDTYEVDDTLINADGVWLDSKSMWNKRMANRSITGIHINGKDLAINVEDIFGPYTYKFENFMKYDVHEKVGVLKDADDSPRKVTVINMGEHHKVIDGDYVPFMDKCGKQYVPN